MAPHRGASGRATSVYSTPWPPTCSGALPNVVHYRGCPLGSLHRGCCNPGCPRAPKPHVHPSAQRKAQGSHSKEAVVSQQWSAGSSSTHSPALSATCIYLLRGQKVANYHSKGNSTLSRRLSCTSGTADCARAVNATCAWMAVFAWGHMMHEQDASAHLVPSCNAGKGG